MDLDIIQTGELYPPMLSTARLRSQVVGMLESNADAVDGKIGAILIGLPIAPIDLRSGAVELPLTSACMWLSYHTHQLAEPKIVATAAPALGGRARLAGAACRRRC